MRARLFAVTVVTALLATLALPLAAGPAPDPVYDTRATATWRETREKDLQSPTGWLTVAGLFFLKTGANIIGSDPASDVALPAGSVPPRLGVVTREDGKTWFEPEAGTDVSINDAAVRGRTELTPASRVRAGRITFFLHSSGDRLAIRVRDPESTLRKEFHGLRWYPIRAEWRLAGTFTAYDAPKPILVQNVLGDIERYVSPGEVTVQVKGVPVRLQAVRSGQRLWFIFSDASAGKETYPIRFLYAEAPAADGTVALDFNRAYNPPCAYNPFTTCPRPPAQNFVKTSITAGEKRY
jgi:uncharacterized protein (DUF1684 family)